MSETSQYYFEYDGKQELIEDIALAKLLTDRELFVCAGEDGNLVVAVNCNDLFYWATADAEIVPYSELPALFAMHLEGRAGCSRWCCRRRKMRPQTPIERLWRAEGIWDEELESFPARDPKECG